MKLRQPKRLGRVFPRDRIDWGYVTLRREGDGLDGREQEIMELDEDDIEDSQEDE